LSNWATLRLSGLGVFAVIQAGVLLHEGSGGETGSDPAWIESGDTLGAVVAITSTGGRTSLATGAPLLLLVFHSECGHCRELVPVWKDWIQESAPGVRIIAVTREPQQRGIEFLASFGWHPELLTVPPSDGWTKSRALVARTPWAFLLDEDGVILAEAHGRMVSQLADEWPEIMAGGRGQP